MMFKYFKHLHDPGCVLVNTDYIKGGSLPFFKEQTRKWRVPVDG